MMSPLLAENLFHRPCNMIQKVFFITLIGLLLKQIKLRFLEGESPTLIVIWAINLKIQIQKQGDTA